MMRYESFFDLHDVDDLALAPLNVGCGILRGRLVVLPHQKI